VTRRDQRRDSFSKKGSFLRRGETCDRMVIKGAKKFLFLDLEGEVSFTTNRVRGKNSKKKKSCSICSDETKGKGGVQFRWREKSDGKKILERFLPLFI